MIHEMKLRPEYFEYINNGTKRIELRLFDEKRELIKLGDTIKVIVTGIDEKGKVSLSRKELLPKPPKQEKVKPAE